METIWHPGADVTGRSWSGESCPTRSRNTATEESVALAAGTDVADPGGEERLVEIVCGAHN